MKATSKMRKTSRRKATLKIRITSKINMKNEDNIKLSAIIAVKYGSCPIHCRACKKGNIVLNRL